MSAPLPPPSAPAPTPRACTEHFARVYTRYFGFVYSLACRLGVRGGDLEDVVQEVFIVVYRRLPDFEHRSRLQTWLAAITRRVAWRHRRSRDRARRKLEALRELEPDQDDFPFLRGQALDRLDRFLHALPEGQREVFVLSELHGLRGPEIVEVTGTKLNTVYARIRSTRQRFARWCEAQTVASGDARPTPAHVLATARQTSKPRRSTRQQAWGLLGTRLGLGVPSTVTAAATTISLSAGLKVLGLVIAVGSVGLWTARQPATRGRAPAATRPAAALVPEASSSPPIASDAAPLRPEPSSSLPIASGASTPSPPTPAPTPSPAARPPARPPSSAVVGPREPSSRKDPIVRRHPSHPPLPTPSSAAIEVDGLERERILITAARQNLEDGAPRAALAWLERHRREHPGGFLAKERRRLSIRAHCAQGQHAQARRLAASADDPAALVARECPSDRSPPASSASP